MKDVLKLSAALLRVTTTLVVALMFCAPVFAQITVTNATFPSAGDTLKMAVNNSPSAINLIFTQPGGPQTWDLSGLNVDATQNFIYRAASEGSVSGQVSGAELVTLPPSPHAEEYYNVTGTRFELQAYYGIAPYDLVSNSLFHYNPPLTERQASLNFFDLYASSSGILEKFLPSAFTPALVAALPATFDSLRYRVAFSQTDAVDAYGSMSIPRGTYNVLREKRTRYTETRLDGKHPVLGWLDITDNAILAGFHGLGVDTTVFFYFYNDVAKEPIARVTLNAAQSAAAQTLFKYNAPTPTPTGTNVVVQPQDNHGGTTPVTMTFATVTQAGNAFLETSGSGPAPPSGFALGNPATYYDISTTATFTGAIAVCVNYTGTTFADEAAIQLRHYEGGAWVDITTSRDAVNNIICGNATSLSPFAIFAPTAPTAPSLTIDNITLNEGNASTTTFDFTVNLDKPAPAGGVTFDIATANGTTNPATAPSDYTTKSLTGQTITASNSTYTFSVLVNGDTDVEANETFFVNVTNVTGADVGDGQGLGTITNDDISCASYIDNRAYVNASATGGNNGTSWADAYTDLQSALANTCPSITEIWVAEGIYKPTSGTNRTISFVMKNGVTIYGGFPNTGNPTMADRNWTTHVTTLSGDLLGDDGPSFTNNSDNSTHVISNSGLDNTAVLDGFTVTAANAISQLYGGGMINNNSSPTVTNCIFSGNMMTKAGVGNDGGGGMVNLNSSPIVTNCTFSGNVTDGNGGGMYNQDGSTPTVTNCVFSGNMAQGGGGMCNLLSSPNSPIVTNCTFSGNTGTSFGGGVYLSQSPTVFTNCAFSGNSAGSLGGGGLFIQNSSPSITNCSISGNTTTGSGGAIRLFSSSNNPSVKNSILWGNSGDEIFIDSGSTITVTYSIVEQTSGIYPGTDNLNQDPLFVSQPPIALGTSGDLHLQTGSPAINFGTNTGAPSTDIEGNPRPLTVANPADMGAYENAPSLPVILTAEGPAAPVLNGASIAVTIKVAQFTNLGTLQFSVNWDETELQLVDNTPLTIDGDAPLIGNPAPDQLTYSWFDTDIDYGVTLPDGTTIITLNFTVLAAAPTTGINVDITDTPTTVEASDVNFAIVPVTLNNLVDFEVIAPPSVKPFVFLANKITLKRTKQHTPAGAIYSNGTLTIEKGDPSTYNSNLTAVGKITIQKDNKINGDVKAPSIKNDGTINGTKTIGAVASEPLPSLSYGAGTTNKTVPSGGSLILAPGSYGIVTINSGGTLKLASGEYFMKELRASSSGIEIEIDLSSGDPITLNVESNLQLGKEAEIRLLPNGESDSELVTFNTLQNSPVNFGKEAYLLGSFNAPNAKVTLVKNSQLRGSICAKEILVERDCLFLHHDAAGTLPGPGDLPKSSSDSDEEEVISDQLSVISDYALEQNYPNPFNPTTVISFQLPVTSDVTLSIFNTNGQLVKKLVAGEMNAGQHNLTWDATNERGERVASGVYLYVIKAGEFTAQRKLVLMK